MAPLFALQAAPGTSEKACLLGRVMELRERRFRQPKMTLKVGAEPLECPPSVKYRGQVPTQCQL